MKFAIETRLASDGLGVEIKAGRMKTAEYNPNSEITWGFTGYNFQEHRFLIESEYGILCSAVKLPNPWREENPEFESHKYEIFARDYGDWILTRLSIYPDSILLGYSSAGAEAPEYLELRKVKLDMEFDIPVSLDPRDGVEIFRVRIEPDPLTGVWSSFIWRASMPWVVMELTYAVDTATAVMEPQPTSWAGKKLKKIIYPTYTKRSALGDFLYRQLYPEQASSEKRSSVPPDYAGLQINMRVHFNLEIRQAGERALPENIVRIAELISKAGVDSEEVAERAIAELTRIVN